MLGLGELMIIVGILVAFGLGSLVAVVFLAIRGR